MNLVLEGLDFGLLFFDLFLVLLGLSFKGGDLVGVGGLEFNVGFNDLEFVVDLAFEGLDSHSLFDDGLLVLCALVLQVNCVGFHLFESLDVGLDLLALGADVEGRLSLFAL